MPETLRIRTLLEKNNSENSLWEITLFLLRQRFFILHTLDTISILAVLLFSLTPNTQHSHDTYTLPTLVASLVDIRNVPT